MKEMPLYRLGLGILLVIAVFGAAAELLRRATEGDSPRGAAALAEAAAPATPRPAPAETTAAPAVASCRIATSGVALPGDVRESSGLAWSRRTRGLLWTHNDSGQPELVGVDEQGTERARVRLTGAAVQDWEDVASAPCGSGSCVYVADIGDNRAARRSITIYRVPEPATSDTATAPAEALHATYPDGPQDAEAIFVLPDGALHVVTKGETGPASLYRFPQPLRPGATVVLEKVAGISTAMLERRDRITGASASPDGRWVGVRTLKTLSLYRITGGAVRGFADPAVIDLSGTNEAQGEGVALADSGTVFLSSESGGKKKPATLARLACTLPQ